MTTRRGILLLEIAVTITLTSAMVYGAVLLFATFQRIDRATRDRAQVRREVARLAEQFREDIRAALDLDFAEPDAPADSRKGALVRLQMPGDQRIEYRAAEPGDLVRAVTSGGELVEREVYALGAAARFAVDHEQQPPAFLTLVITLADETDNETTPTTQRRLVAQLGRDHRHHPSAGKEHRQ